MPLMTTGEVARLCSVQPDTVLKWIKAGRLRAVRTAGGHHRIDPRDVPQLGRVLPPLEPVPAEPLPRPLRCWEYHAGGGEVRAACRECLVYRARAAWCFQMRDAPGKHSLLPCAGSCDGCAYYQRVTGDAIRLLVITRDEDMLERFRTEPGQKIEIGIGRNAYEASAAVDRFRPQFVVLDCEIRDWRELFACLAGDSRVIGLKIVLVLSGGNGDFQVPVPEAVAGTLPKPLGVREVLGIVDRFPVERCTAPASVCVHNLL